MGFKGLNSKCLKKLKGKNTRKLSVNSVPGSGIVTVTGQMRYPTASCRGWKAWESLSLTVTSQ
jgi:hypothetical protein